MTNSHLPSYLKPKILTLYKFSWRVGGLGRLKWFVGSTSLKIVVVILYICGLDTPVPGLTVLLHFKSL